jgi:hypothetical protein
LETTSRVMRGCRMGNPRIPDAVKAARGTLKPCRTNAAQPKLDPSFLPPPPAGLAADEVVIWAEMAMVVDPMRVATLADVRCFRAMVYALANMDRAQRNRKAGQTERATAIKTARAAMADFGVTPASRAKVSAMPAPAKADPLAEFLS